MMHNVFQFNSPSMGSLYRIRILCQEVTGIVDTFSIHIILVLMFRTVWEITYGGMNLVLKKVKFMMTLTEFREARDLLSGILSNTSLIHSPYYSKRTGGEVYIKPENMQVTGAYKVRGACYKVSTLTEEEKAQGTCHGFCGQPCPGRGLCGPAGRNRGHHCDANHHAAGEGKQHQGLWRPCGIGGQLL